MSERTKGRGSGEERLEHRNDGQQINKEGGRVEGRKLETKGNWDGVPWSRSVPIYLLAANKLWGLLLDSLLLVELK